MKMIQVKRKWIGLLAGMLAIGSMAVAQPVEKFIKVNIAPQHSDWVYKPGETVKFDVSVTKNNILLSNVEISYEFGPERMPPVKKDKQTLKDGKTVIDAGTMMTAGLEQFWDNAKSELAKTPLDARMIHLTGFYSQINQLINIEYERT